MPWQFQYTPFIWSMLASAAFMTLLGIYTRRRLRIPAAGPTSFLLFLAAAWSLCSVIRTASADLPTAAFWYQALILSTLPIPLCSLVFALQYAGMSNWLTRPRFAVLAIVPFITFLLIITNDAHGLMWSRLWLENGQILFEPGPWNWVYALYSSLLILIHLVVVAGVFIQSQGLLRWQSGTILLAWLLPLLAQGIEAINANPFEPLDLVVLAFNVTGLGYALAIFRFHMLDLAPITHAAIMEKLYDGLVVMDMQNRLIEINPAAQKLLALRASQVIGQDAAQALQSWPDLTKLFREPGMRRAEVRLSATASQRYDVGVWPLTDFRDLQVGRLIILHDNTELRQAQERLLQQQRALAALREREWLGWELHDGLSQALNFINVQSQAARELIEAGRSKEACALLSRLTSIAQDAQRDMRALIAGLSTMVPPQREFFPVLQQRLEQFSHDFHIHTELVVPQDQRVVSFEPAIEAELLKIIQEALANVRKHARAQNVSVKFALDTTFAEVVIEDDGIGFDPAELDGNCLKFGLRIMQDRASQIGGRLYVYTAPREGTRVIAQVPWRKEAEENASQSIIG